MTERENPTTDNSRDAYINRVIEFIQSRYSPDGNPPEFTLSTREIIRHLSDHFLDIELYEQEIRDRLERNGFKLFEVEQMNFQWGFSRKHPSLPS
jgi:hypothetical protein